MGLKFRRGTTAQKSGSLAFGEPYVNTTLGTLQIGGESGDITLGSSGTGSQGSFAGISGSSLDITGNAKIDGNLRLGGNITIGDNTADNVTVVASLSSSLIPSTTDIFDLGSPSKQWRDLYLSSASLYIDGTQVLSSNATELIFTTDTGQSIKFNELGSDNITLQTVDGDIELKSSGGGDLLLDPTAGLISVKGNISMQDGTAKFLSSGGSKIIFGNDIEVTGSIITNGTINGLTFSTGIVSSSAQTIANLPTGTVSGSSQITYANISSIPAGIVSGSSQTIANLPTGVVSGSSQLDGTTITNLTITNLTTVNQTASVVFSSGSNRFGDAGNDTHSFTGSVQVSGSLTTIGTLTATSFNGTINATNGVVSGSAQIDGSLLGSNKTITIGSTSTTLGGTSTTLAGLTSVTSTTFVGALTGNASTVTTNANLTGNVTSVGNATTIASGVVTSDMIVDGTIVNGDINASAAIVDTKLATIATAGKVSNSATTATNANTVSAIVARDASGNFSAGTITAALTGNASTATTAAALTTARTINGTSFDGSANITIANLVSGSSQITLSSTTGYGTVINQNVLTTSNVQFNSLGIGMAASATAGRIDATNDVVAFSSSDIRFKENIVPIENALDKISKISGNTYDWKEENKIEHGYEGNDVGVIAQEIEAVLPQLVQTRENGYKAVKYDKLVALLIEGIKEQQTQIHSLTIEIEKLKEAKGL